jgi:mono/diheme cytochrome c family protein
MKRAKQMVPKQTRKSEHADPSELYNPIPRVIIGLIIGLIIWAIYYIFTSNPSGVASMGDHRIPSALVSSAGGKGGVVDGRQIFTGTCQACHQATGQGLPGVFPPLAGSSFVTGDPHVLAQIVLHGLHGPIEVSGTTYNGSMPAFGSQFGDAEIAAVLSYIRKEWGNASPAIDADLVKQSRALTAKRTEPWTNVKDIEAAVGGQAKPADEKS